MTDRRGRLLLVTLAAARLRTNVHPLPALRSWLDSWRGVGDVERGIGVPENIVRMAAFTVA